MLKKFDLLIEDTIEGIKKGTNDKIYIKSSPTADTRTCDPTTVTKETLQDSSISHINDIHKGMEFFSDMCKEAAKNHDHDKLSGIEHFHSDFITGFKEHGWWDNHRKVNRHHLNNDDGIPSDVNLVDVIEYITDCVMAGLARSGSVYDIKIKPEVLEQAFQNSITLLKSKVIVEPKEK